MKEIQVALAQSRVADGTDAAFEFVKDEDQLFAGQRSAELIDVRRLVGAEGGIQLCTDHTPERFEGKIGELASDDAGVGRRGKGEPVLGKPGLTFGGGVAKVQGYQEAVGFADTFGAFSEK